MPFRIKFGVVGCGRISEKHLSALTQESVRAELVAVTDIVPKRARAKSEKYHVPWYTDYHDMMRQHPEIEVIDVLTPTGHHARHVVDLARYGRPIRWGQRRPPLGVYSMMRLLIILHFLAVSA